MLEYVHVLGAVARPGRYEFVEGETAWSLIELAGGYARAAVPGSSELRRFVDDRTTEGTPLNMNDEDDRRVFVGPGDQLYVPYRTEWHVAQFVRVDGEVALPGHYGINEGADRVSDVVRRAGGPTTRASLRDALIIRLRPDDKSDPELERLSETPVDRMTEMEYAYLKTRYRQDKRSVDVDFEALLGGMEAEDPLLRHNDRIVFPKAQQTVLVSGQVMMPGHVPYEPDERYTHYVSLVGGYTDAANKSRVMVIRDGTGHQFRARRAREIFPGDEIWVPEEPDENWWDNARDVLAFISSLATVYLVIDQATGN
jgi:protein involved in polysaccharide export with SLBB domain